MPTAMLETAEEVIARWRSSPDTDNPAGPLYAAGVFAKADIAAPDMVASGLVCQTDRCSACTASRAIPCC